MNGTPQPATGERKILKGVTPSGESSPLLGLLSNWYWMTVKCADTWQYQEAPWCYGEKAAIGLFSAAVWQSSGIALEENRARNIKRSKGSASKAKKPNAPGGFYFRLHKNDYVCSAKRIGVPLKESVEKGMGRIYKALTAARISVQSQELNPQDTALAVLFVSWEHVRPKSGWAQPVAMIRESIVEWHEYLEKHAEKEFTAATWFFPLHAVESLHDARIFYPGCAVLIKECTPRVY